jgi:hypothetical protein
MFLVTILCCPMAQASYRIVADIPGDAAYADSVIRITRGRLQQLIGPFEFDSLNVHIVASERKFDSLAGNSVPDWGAAVAMPLRRQIVIKSPLILSGDKSLGELVAHEFSHVALAQAVRFQKVPRWMDEGMAQYVSAEWGWGDNLATSWAVVIGSVIPLGDIERLNRFKGSRVRVAYSESYLAFKYFVDNYGHSSLRILLENIRAGRSNDYAFAAAIGIDHAAFDREFSIYLTGRYNLITLIFNSNLIWILLALVIVVGFIITRVKRKKRLEEFDEYDKYHSTDFDYGNVEEPDEDKPWD